MKLLLKYFVGCITALALFFQAKTLHAQGVDSASMVQKNYELVQLKDTSVWVPGPRPIKKFYLASGIDAFVFGMAKYSIITNGSMKNKLSTPRFSAFFHFGVNAHYDFSNHIGFFTGLGIKNIGMIVKEGNTKTKFRVYTIGIPVGIKFGSIQKHTYGFLGGGVDFPFQYKQKFIDANGQKTKYNEWLGSSTEKVLPYLFVGACIKPGITLKLQYYPDDFMTDIAWLPGNVFNPGYQIVLPQKNPMYLISLGFDVRYKRSGTLRYVDDGK